MENPFILALMQTMPSSIAPDILYVCSSFSISLKKPSVQNCQVSSAQDGSQQMPNKVQLILLIIWKAYFYYYSLKLKFFLQPDYIGDLYSTLVTIILFAHKTSVHL